MNKYYPLEKLFHMNFDIENEYNNRIHSPSTSVTSLKINPFIKGVRKPEEYPLFIYNSAELILILEKIILIVPRLLPNKVYFQKLHKKSSLICCLSTNFKVLMKSKVFIVQKKRLAKHFLKKIVIPLTLDVLLVWPHYILT